MMKSFFKKLAFVMALAMVVSAMAPAATAKAAEKLGICFQEDTTWTAVEAYEFTEGDAAKDFKFAGAPANWRELGLTWASSDDKVATVDQTGLITPVAVGEAVVTLKGGDYEGSIKITVSAKDEDGIRTFKAEQKTAYTAVLTFADEATAKAAAASVSVVKLISTVDGDKPMPCVLNDEKTKVDGKTVTIEPWVAFGTATYVISVDGFEPYVLSTAVGAPKNIAFGYNKPYVYTETKKPAEVTLTVTDDNGVQVTDYTAYYELVSATPNGYAYVNSSKGDLYFYANNVEAKVKVTISYTENGVKKSISAEDTFKSTAQPTVTLNNYIDTTAVITQASVLKDDKVTVDTAKVDKIVWGSSQIKIGDGEAQVVGLIQKSDNSSYSINKWSVGTKNAQLDANQSNYKFTYESTDSSKAIVNGATGTLVGVNTTEAGKPVYVLVRLHTKVNNKFNDGVIVAAVPVEVQAKKAADHTSLGANNSAILLTDGDYTSVDVTPKTVDQYGGDWADTIKSATTTFNNKTYTAPYKKDKNGADVKTTVVIDAELVNDYFNKDTDIKNNYFVFDITMNSGKKTQFFLTLKEVNDDNRDNQTFDLSTTSAVVTSKAEDLGKKVGISVTSMVLGEKYGAAPFYFGKPDTSVVTEKSIGALYVVVRDPSGDVITPATSSAVVTGNKWEKDALATATGKLATLETGLYTVDLYQIMDVIEDTDNNRTVIFDTVIDTDYFTVDNKLPNAATDVKINLKNANGNANKVAVGTDGKTIAFLSEGTITFKVENTTYDVVKDAGKITVSGITTPGSTDVFVYSITVKHTVGGGHVEITVPVNKTFTR